MVTTPRGPFGQRYSLMVRRRDSSVPRNHPASSTCRRRAAATSFSFWVFHHRREAAVGRVLVGPGQPLGDDLLFLLELAGHREGRHLAVRHIHSPGLACRKSAIVAKDRPGLCGVLAEGVLPIDRNGQQKPQNLGHWKHSQARKHPAGLIPNPVRIDLFPRWAPVCRPRLPLTHVPAACGARAEGCALSGPSRAFVS